MLGLTNLSSSVLEGTELCLDRDEAVVFKDAKTPEHLLLKYKSHKRCSRSVHTVAKAIDHRERPLYFNKTCIEFK